MKKNTSSHTVPSTEIGKKKRSYNQEMDTRPVESNYSNVTGSKNEPLVPSSTNSVTPMAPYPGENALC